MKIISINKVVLSLIILGIYLNDLKRYEKAIESFDKSLQIKPNANCYYLKGIFINY